MSDNDDENYDIILNKKILFIYDNYDNDDNENGRMSDNMMMIR